MKKIVIEGISSRGSFFNILNQTRFTGDIVFGNIISNEGNIEIEYNDHDAMKENYLILNIDSHHIPDDLPDYEGYRVITIGFNPRASVTVSSVEDEEIVLCIQRTIMTLGRDIQPQEYVIKNTWLREGNTVINCLALFSMLLIIEKDLLESNNYF